MKLIIPKQHLLFVIAYVVNLLILLLYQIDALPFAIILRKAKYLYVIFVLFLFLLNNKINRKNGGALLTIGVFLLHTILFGYIFTNPIAAENIDNNASQMLWYILTVLVTYLYVAQNDLFETFINVSFYVVMGHAILSVLLHPHDIVNPIWGFMQAFGGGIRYKTTFGYVHAGYLSNAAYLMVILCIYFYELNKKYVGIRKKIMWISLVIMGLVAIEMLAAAAERSGIISAAIVGAFYVVFVFFKVRVEQKTMVIFAAIGIIAIEIMAGAGVFEYIWANSNRSLNITVNYPVFQQLGNLWTGMGFVDNSGFHKEIAAFGVETSSLDLYYVYIFFTTGVVGCILIGSGLLMMLFKLLFQKKTDLNLTTLGLYLSMLFFAFWQCNMVTYRYVSPTILFTIILCGMTHDFCMGDQQCTEQYFEKIDGI